MTALERAASAVLRQAYNVGLLRGWKHCRGVFEVVTRDYRSLSLDAEAVGLWMAAALPEHGLHGYPSGGDLLDAMEALAEHMSWWEVKP